MPSKPQKQDRRPGLRHRGIPVGVPADTHPMVATKLWDNPCWLSFRVNFIAHHFNHPIYEHIWRRYRLNGPEHVVLYAVALSEGITADDVAASSARPKNTLSRAVNRLVAKKLLLRRFDPDDARRRLLFLTRAGKSVVDETVPIFVAHEQSMTAALTNAEQSELERLLTKVILGRARWLERLNTVEAS